MALGNVPDVGGPIRVLFVDDDPAFASLATQMLERRDELVVDSAGDAATALDRLAASAYDCIVADHELETHTGLDLLHRVRDAGDDVPFILFTGRGSEDVAAEAISAGVTDYVQKGTDGEQFHVLAHRVVSAVTSARQADRLAQTQAWYRAVVEQSLVGLYILRDRRLVFANDCLVDLLGYDREAAVGRPILDFVVEEYHDTVREKLRLREEGVADTVAYTVDVYDADGSTVTLEVSGRRVELDGSPAIVGTAMDVTARRESERRLRESERLTRQILSSLPDTVLISDPDEFDVVYVNSAYETHWGRTAESLYEDPLSFLELVHVDDRERVRSRVEAVFEDVADGRVDASYEFEFRYLPASSDEVRWARARLGPLYGDGGAVKNVLVVVSDLTAHISRERELAQQNARLEEFARVLSHDIRGPLSVAQGRLDLAREFDDDAHLDHVERAHDRITDVVEDVLSLARDERTRGDESDVALADAAAKAWDMCRPTAGDTSCEIGSLPVVTGDESRLVRLFDNLFRNAIQHGRSTASTGGEATAGTARSDGGRTLTISVGALPSSGGFYVEDDGRGIPEQIRDEVFRTGFTTNDTGGGNGLGLDIVQQIVRTHGWTIRATESDSGGARFEVLLDPFGTGPDG